MLLAKASLKTGPGSGLVIHITLVYPGQSFKYQVFILASFVQSADLSIYFGFFFPITFFNIFSVSFVNFFFAKANYVFVGYYLSLMSTFFLTIFFFNYYCI